MKKLEVSHYKGIDYININDLSETQRRLFLDWIDVESIIKIQKHTGIIDGCVQYAEYSYWYENVLHSDVVEVNKSSSLKSHENKVNWALE